MEQPTTETTTAAEGRGLSGPPSERDVRDAYAARSREPQGRIREDRGGLVPSESELVSSLFGQVLEDREGPGFRETVDRLGDSAAAFRLGDEGAGARLFELVRELPPSSLDEYVRACSIQLQLKGIEERARRVGLRQRDHSNPKWPEHEVTDILRQLGDPRMGDPQRERLEGRAQELLEAWWQMEHGAVSGPADDG